MFAIRLSDSRRLSIATATRRSNICIAALLLCLTTAAVDAQSNVPWRTGSDFERQLGAGIGFEWRASPVRAGIQSIAANQKVAIWLDRRVDPGFEVDLLVQDATLKEGLQRIGSAVGGGVSFVGSVAYIGSPEVTQRLATLAALRRDEVKRLPTAARTKFATSAAWQWEELSTPKELLADLTISANTNVVNPELIVHDLWAASDWPAMPMTDRLTLLLAGFDLHFEIARDGSAIRLIEMPNEATIERSYTPGTSLNAVTARIAKALPNVAVKKSGTRLTINGTFEQHQDVANLLRGKPVRTAPMDNVEKLFDLRVENELIGGIIKTIANREKLEVKADEASLAMLSRRVSFEVKQLTLDALLKRTLAETGISHQIEGSVLELQVVAP